MTALKKQKSQPMESVKDDRDYSGSTMPDLVTGTPPLSYFEFWSASVFYLPMKVYAAWLSLRYGGLTIPTITDPLFDVGGLHGESKAQIATQIPESLDAQFAYTIPMKKEVGEATIITLARGLKSLKEKNFKYPIIMKPDIGMRGMGVQRAYEDADIEQYIEKFPEGASMIFQEMYDYPCEVGLFYIRKPSEEKGQIFSLTAKYFSHVIGDGKTSLKALIENHERYGRIAHVYLPRHEDKWDLVLDEGEKFRIAFAGSHSRGTIFKDGNHLITPKMEEAWDRLSKQIPEFYFGRFDVRFHNLEDLETLENIKIVEINGAGAEATHIWDSKTSLWTAYKTLMRQYKYMYQIGAENKKRGFKPMPVRAFLKHMDNAEKLADLYPPTH